MSDIRARLAEALREHFKLHRAGRPEEWVCGGCHADFHNFRCHEDHVADVLLSLEGVAIVGLPEPDSLSGWNIDDIGQVDVYRGELGIVLTPAQYGVQLTHIGPDLVTTPAEARALAAALLAAADAAKAAGGEHDPECEDRGRYDRFEGVDYCAGCGAAQS